MWNFSSGERAIALLVVMSVSMSIFCVRSMPANAQGIERAEQLSKINASFEDKEPSVIAPTSSQIDILGPVGSGEFGLRAVPLPNGNIVVLDRTYDAPGGITDVGAFHLYSPTGVLISTMTGTQADQGVGGAVTVLPNGNYFVTSASWDNGAVNGVGAHTWCSGVTGCSGVISSANSLIGTTALDGVGATTIILSNGNYVVVSQLWDNGAVVNAGAVTWCSGTTGCAGTVSSSNSTVGTTASAFFSAVPLANGNFIIRNSTWSGTATNAGAVRWCNGTTGCTGAITSANSLVGSTAQDQVGLSSAALASGNYLVRTRLWDGVAADVGAVTLCNGSAGCTGTISAANSLVGTTLNDQVGGTAGVAELTNGKYVVTSPLWNGAAADIGAVTLCSGTTGCVGSVSAANSLTGVTANDQVGVSGAVALTNGNYVVPSYRWDGAAVDVGAVTWCSGTVGCAGAVSAANSLIGSSLNDNVGGPSSFSVVPLTNGNYVVASPFWNNSLADVGAVTFCNGSTGCVGSVSTANSLTGSSAGDGVGGATVGASQSPTALTNGNYVVRSRLWDGAAPDVGAVTWCNGTAGCTGNVSSANSLVGSTQNDQIGDFALRVLQNGNYVISSTLWDGGAADIGAVTWCNGATGRTGTVSAANSIVGSTAGDRVGHDDPDSVGLGNVDLLEMPNGDFFFGAGKWDNGGIVDAGAVIYASRTGNTVGTINSNNAVLGTATNRGPWLYAAVVQYGQNLIVGREGSNLFTIYTPDASGADVSGRILTSGGRGVRGAVVRLNDGPTVLQTVLTDAFGRYRFQGVATGRSYTITAMQRRFSFATRGVTVNGALSDIDITASP